MKELTAFACSLVVSLKCLSKAFPYWIKLDRDDTLTYRFPDASHQVETCVKECHKAFPEGAFRDYDDFSAVLNATAAV